MSIQLSTWKEVHGFPLVCELCRRSISTFAEVRWHGIRFDEQGREVERFLRCKECVR